MVYGSAKDDQQEIWTNLFKQQELGFQKQKIYPGDGTWKVVEVLANEPKEIVAHQFWNLGNQNWKKAHEHLEA